MTPLSIAAFLLLLSLPCLSYSASLSHQLTGSRPNIVLIMADDMGWGDLGANWPNTRDTPFLDHLAAQSLRLTDYHSGASVCSVSRAALLTGRLTPRHGVWQNFNVEGIGGLPTNETIISEYLKAAGYVSGIHGKWHLGHNPPFHPSYRGFDEYVGVPYSLDNGCTDNPGVNLPPVPVCPKDPTNIFHYEQPHERDDDWARLLATTINDTDPAVPLYQCLKPQCTGGDCNNDIIEQPVNLTTLTQHYVDSDRAFIERNVRNNKPFFLYMPLSHMHVPHATGQEFKGRSHAGTIYGDTLRELDHHINRTYHTLQSLGVLNNTLLIFTSDNGGWSAKCDLAGNSGPLSGAWQAFPLPYGGGGGGTAKFTTWEAGHRVPFLAHWLGRIKPRVSTAIGSNLDMLPTIARLAGMALPTDRSFDGIDLNPVLFDGSDTGHETLFHPDQNGTLSAVRYINYKAYYTTYPANDGACGGQVGEIINHSPPLIFDLATDLGESTPVTPSKAVYAAIEAALQAKLKDIATTPRSRADYRTGGLDARACCDAGHVVCRCRQ